MLSRVNYTLTQLEYVMAVNRLGHFAKAAAACSVTQPTLSMQIQKLETDLGLVLFDRTKKPILLTEAGKRLIGQIQSILFEAKKLEGLVQSTKTAALEGHLALGVIPTVAPYLLPRLLPVLERVHPGIQLTLHELQTHRIVEALNNDELEAGVLATPLKLPQIRENALYYEPFAVLCRKEHPLARLKRARYAQLSFEDLWLLEEGHCLRHQVLDVCALKKNRKPRRYEFESGSLETLKSLVDSYGGYTLLPALAEERLGAKSVLVPFERPIPAREIGIVYRREHYKIDLLEAVGECILECIPERIRKIRPKDLDVLEVQ